MAPHIEPDALSTIIWFSFGDNGEKLPAASLATALVRTAPVAKPNNVTQDAVLVFLRVTTCPLVCRFLLPEIVAELWATLYSLTDKSNWSI